MTNSYEIRKIMNLLEGVNNPSSVKDNARKAAEGIAVAVIKDLRDRLSSKQISISKEIKNNEKAIIIKASSTAIFGNLLSKLFSERFTSTKTIADIKRNFDIEKNFGAKDLDIRKVKTANPKNSTYEIYPKGEQIHKVGAIQVHYEDDGEGTAAAGIVIRFVYSKEEFQSDELETIWNRLPNYRK